MKRVNKKAIRKTNLLRKFTMNSKVKVKYSIHQVFPFTSLWGRQRKAEGNSWNNSWANCSVKPWGREVSGRPIGQSLRKPAPPPQRGGRATLSFSAL